MPTHAGHISQNMKSQSSQSQTHCTEYVARTYAEKSPIFEWMRSWSSAIGSGYSALVRGWQ
jgi:hypothetical protein